MKTRSHSFKLLLFGTAIPFVLMLALVIIFINNNRPPKIFVPTPKMPKDNAWDDFVRAGELIRKVGHLGPLSTPRPVESWTIPEYESFVKDNAPVLALVRKGLTKEYLHPPERDDMLPLIRYNSSFREIARTFAGEAKYYQVIRENGKAVSSLLDCIEFGVTLPKGATFITAMVASATEGIGSFQLNPLIEDLDKEVLKQVAARLEKIQEKRVSFSNVMIEESNLTAAAGASMFSDPTTIKQMANPKSWLTEEIYVSTTPSSKAEQVWKNMRFAFVNKAALVRAERDYYKAVGKEQSGQYTGKSKVKVPKNSFTVMGSEFIIGSRANFERNIAFVSLVQTEVALRRYRLDHGSYPKSLSDLSPAYLKLLPVDPFGRGKTFKYKSLNNGKSFLLYSLGPNMKDDSGKQEPWHTAATHGDLVAGKKWSR